jgi:glycosyltransferase involved in cell wall biosynthesis
MKPVFPAIFLTPDAVQTNTSKLMGRQSAGRGFMRGMAQVYGSTHEALRLVHGGGAHQAVLEAEARDTGWTGSIQHGLAKDPSQWAKDVLYCPAPISTRMAWQRSRWGVDSVALCGVTHTISSSGMLAQIADYVSGPFASWDALICTSQSVRKAVHQVWDVRREQLAQRLGVPSVNPTMPMTPLIPLGVHVDDFTPDAALRAQGRAEWGLADDEVMVLFVGRLSAHAKANPLPMYLTCARAAAQTGKRVRVVECGWFSNDGIRKAFAEAAALAGVAVTLVDGREAGVTRKAFASADVFMSLSDNIQETFGLTPLEAMAAGLPVVASDWDGYRETVRDGVDGFLVPTLQPSDPMCAKAMSEAYEDGRMNYDYYIGHAHLMVGVDVAACTQALAKLINDPALRQCMGDAGRAHAREVYDWSVVMKQYQVLWTEQNTRRLAAAGTAVAAPVRDPAFINPLTLFDHYPSHALRADAVLWRDAAFDVNTLPTVRALGLWSFVGERLDTAEKLQQALACLPLHGEPGMPLRTWAQQFGWPMHKALRQAVWLHKVGGVAV